MYYARIEEVRCVCDCREAADVVRLTRLLHAARIPIMTNKSELFPGFYPALERLILDSLYRTRFLSGLCYDCRSSRGYDTEDLIRLQVEPAIAPWLR